MKKIKLIFALSFLLFAIISCNKDIVGIDQNSTATSTAANNISKLFNIATDNSGLVTVTPIGNSVSASTITFGHGTGSAASAIVPPGGNATHVYPEGTYTVTIVSTDLIGNQTTNTYPLTVTYIAPINLLPNKSINNDGAAVKPTANYASSFKVDFGDGSPVLPIAIGAMANHIYAAPGTYNAKVTAISGNSLYAGAAIKDTTFPIIIAAPPAPPFALPITFDNTAVNYFFGSFGGGQTFTTVANPNPSGINTTASCGKFVRGWDSWSGTYSPLNLNMDFSTTKKIKLWVYNPDPALVGLQLNCELESALGGIPANGVGVLRQPFTKSGVWEELVYDFSTTAITANAKYGQIVFRFNDSYTGAGTGGQFATFYIDNIRLTN